MHAPLPCIPFAAAPTMHSPCHAPHACLPDTHTHTCPLPCMPPCHTHPPLPCIPPAMHALLSDMFPCHACPLPTMHIPPPCMPPPHMPLTMHTHPHPPPCMPTPFEENPRRLCKHNLPATTLRTLKIIRLEGTGCPSPVLCINDISWNILYVIFIDLLSSHLENYHWIHLSVHNNKIYRFNEKYWQSTFDQIVIKDKCCTYLPFRRKIERCRRLAM